MKVEELERLHEALQARGDIDAAAYAGFRIKEWVAQALPDIIATYRERDSYKAALEGIRDADWVENSLNPQRAAEIARTALERNQRGSE